MVRTARRQHSYQLLSRLRLQSGSDGTQHRPHPPGKLTIACSTNCRRELCRTLVFQRRLDARRRFGDARHCLGRALRTGSSALNRCPRAPTALMPALSAAAAQDECPRAGPLGNRSTMTAYQKLVQSPSATPLASSDPITQSSLPQ
jgi:hypothetical protein